MFKDKKSKSKNKNDDSFIKESVKEKMRMGTDSYIENPQDEKQRRWAMDDDEHHSKEIKALENKKRFFKKDMKMENVLPDGEEKEEKIPRRFGYFETKEGTMLVGYDKYKKDSLMGFSLLSDDETEEKNLPENDAYDMNTYFGKNYQGNEKYFESSALSFTYDRKNESIQKLVDDDNDSSNDSEELLYQTSKEDKNKEKLENIKNVIPEQQKNKLEKRITITEQIKEEKEEKNKRFLEEIQKFIEHFNNDKLNRFIDSEDAIVRRKRITEMSIWIIEYTRIKKMLEDMNIEGLNLEEIYSLIKDKVNRISKADIKRIIDQLKNQ